MNEDIIVIEDEESDRYSRLRMIPWWDQSKLKDAKILVAGAGALGCEILKNLALLGVGHILIVDFDQVAASNLSRSVLYRVDDAGAFKAEVATKAIREMNTDINVQAVNGNIAHDLGLGVFREVDLVIAGLDNRAARLAINRKCWKVSTPWIDGAIDMLSGIARVFIPHEGPCYECTMNETDFQLLNQRKSCSLLEHSNITTGKIPTTPTVASIIAAIQVQEAIKFLHQDKELPFLDGQGFVFDGKKHDSFQVKYSRRDNCLSHYVYNNIWEVDYLSCEISFRNILKIAREKLGQEAVVDLERDVIYEWFCPGCNVVKSTFQFLDATTENQSICETCGSQRDFKATQEVSGKEWFIEENLEDLGLPHFDIFHARIGVEKSIQIEIRGDRSVLLEEFLSGS